jgi:ABC-type xylose transport system permease subunit
MAIVTLANSFQVTLAGLGMREGLAMVLLAGEGVGPEAAVAASFLQTCLGQFAPALAGLAARPVPESAGGTEGVGAAGATGAAGAAGAATPPPAPD